MLVIIIIIAFLKFLMSVDICESLKTLYDFESVCNLPR